MRFCLEKMLKLLMIGCLMFIPLISFSVLLPFSESDCSLLKNPKTVLLVHATWCSHCRAFMPVYEAVSNKNQYSDWTFYRVAADDLWRICGKVVDSYPVTYKNNMQTALRGNTPQAALEQFLDSL